jgi:peptidoglycan/LPS O-acetylase OafA/YrhL
MTEFILFCSAFTTVFALGFQQQNVIHRHFRSAALTSFAIGASQIYLWRTLPDSNWSEIIATLMGGPVGIIAAMWLHPKILKHKR